VLVTEIQQRRVCGAGRVHSAQGLGLAGSLWRAQGWGDRTSRGRYPESQQAL